MCPQAQAQRVSGYQTSMGQAILREARDPGLEVSVATGGAAGLDKAATFKKLLIALGLVLMVVVAPVCGWVFLGVDEAYKKHWFGFAAGAFGLGLILVVNSVRALGDIRRARGLLR